MVNSETVALSRGLRDARVAAGFSKTDAAKKIGVHYVTLYAWENERRSDRPTDENLAKAARVYRTTVDQIRPNASSIALASASPPAAAPAKRGPKPGAKRAALANGDRSRNVGNTTGLTPRHQDTGTDGQLPQQAYAKALRVLADIADETPLPPSKLAAAHAALTDPGLLKLFEAFSSGPMSTEDIVAAIDSAGVAVRSFVANRKPAFA